MSTTLGNFGWSLGSILLGVLFPKSLFRFSFEANWELLFFSCEKSEHLLRSLMLLTGVTFSECLLDILSCDSFLSITGECLGLNSEPRWHSDPDPSSSFINLTLHSEFLREDLDASLLRLLPMELLRLGLDTVIMGRMAIDGVGVGGLTYTSGTVDTGIAVSSWDDMLLQGDLSSSF